MKNKPYRVLAFLLMMVLLVGAVGCSGQKEQEGDMNIVNLMVNYLRDPVGIDTKPYFSWNMESAVTGAAQKAYEIVVSTSEDASDKKAVVWDSGKVSSNISVNLPYEGPALQSSTRYYWQTTVWNEKGEKITADPAYFETGLLEENAWEDAAWIKAPDESSQVDRDTLHYTLEADVQLLEEAVGIIFSGKDSNNCYMWQLNIAEHTDAEGNPVLYLRPHIWTDGQYTLKEYKIENTVSASVIQKQMIHLLIDVNGYEIQTYLNGALVNTYRNQDAFLGKIGFRSSGAESGYLDNLVYTNYLADGTTEVIASYDFNGVNPFSAGSLQDGRLCTKLTSSAVIFDESYSGGIPMFRKEFTAEKEIEAVKIYAAALGVYDLYFNGQRVGKDEMKPGWSDYNTRVLYYTYDVTDLAVKGTNVIGAMVGSGWWAGRISYGTYGYRDVGFIAKILVQYQDGTSEWIHTDTTWEAVIGGPIRAADIWDGETYDANYAGIQWLEAGFSGSDAAIAEGWSSALNYGVYQGVVSAQVGTTVQVREELTRTPVSITVYEGTEDTGTDYGAIHVIGTYQDGDIINLQPEQTAVFDMGQNMVGWPQITVKGQQHTLITMHFGEMLNDTGALSRGNDGPAGSVYMANYRSAASTGRYILCGAAAGETYAPSMTFYGFRYVSITATGEVEISQLKGMVLGSANEEIGTLETSNSSINQLYSNIIWGQRSNYLSVPTDCPQRDERLGWTGDTQMFIGAAAYNANVAGFFQKWLQDCRDSQRDSGAYTDVVPFSNAVGAGNAAWADAGIIVPYTMYKMYGDLSVLKASYASMEKYMAFLEKGGLGGTGTAYGDWLAYETTDVNVITCAYYAYDAMLMAEMSEVLGYEDKTASYQSLYKEIKAYFCNKYFHDDGTMRIKTQTAYVLALKLNLVPSEESRELLIQALADKIADNGYKLSTGFVGTGYLPLTLSQVGLSNLSYTLLLQRDNPSWLYSVDQGATTIWERWNSYTLAAGFGDVSMNSFNHYAYGAVSQWMYQYMAGIALDEDTAAFRHFCLQPQPDTRSAEEILPDQEKVTWVKASYVSMYGTIKSAWSTAEDCGGLFSYEVTVPANTSATLTLPLISDSAAFVTINGTSYALSDLKSCAVEGVTYVSANNKAVVLELTAGSHTFLVK